jgi:hypothetical protein
VDVAAGGVGRVVAVAVGEGASRVGLAVAGGAAEEGAGRDGRAVAVAVGEGAGRVDVAAAVAVGEGDVRVGLAVAAAVGEGVGSGRGVAAVVALAVGRGGGAGEERASGAGRGVGIAVAGAVGISVGGLGRGVGVAAGAEAAVGVARRATTTLGPQDTAGSRRAAAARARVVFDVRVTGGASYRPGVSASASRSFPAGTFWSSVFLPEGQRIATRSAEAASPRPKKSDLEPDERKE